MKFTFGKYKGQGILSVYDTAPGYCRWVAQNTDTPEATEIIRLQQVDSHLHLASEGVQDGSDWKVATYLGKIQDSGMISEAQGARFMAIVQAAAEAGLIELG